MHVGVNNLVPTRDYAFVGQLLISAQRDLVKEITISVLRVEPLLKQLYADPKEFLMFCVRPHKVQSSKTHCDLAETKKVGLEKTCMKMHSHVKCGSIMSEEKRLNGFPTVMDGGRS